MLVDSVEERLAIVVSESQDRIGRARLQRRIGNPDAALT